MSTQGVRGRMTRERQRVSNALGGAEVKPGTPFPHGASACASGSRASARRACVAGPWRHGTRSSARGSAWGSVPAEPLAGPFGVCYVAFAGTHERRYRGEHLLELAAP